MPSRVIGEKSNGPPSNRGRSGRGGTFPLEEKLLMLWPAGTFSHRSVRRAFLGGATVWRGVSFLCVSYDLLHNHKLDMKKRSITSAGEGTLPVFFLIVS